MTRVMRRVPALLPMLGVAVSLLTVAPASAAMTEFEKTQPIRQAFEDYQAALDQGEARVAGFLVSPETLRFFEEARQYALKADAAQLGAIPLVQQLLALRLRLEVPLSTLRDGTAEDLVGAAVQRGMLTRTDRDLHIGNIRVRDDEAVADQVDRAGRPEGIRWRFKKVRGHWRVDLLPSLLAGDAYMKALLAQSGLSRERFLLRLIEQSTGRTAGEALLMPPLPPGPDQGPQGQTRR